MGRDPLSNGRATLDPHGHQPLHTAGAKLADAQSAILLVHGRGGSAANILELGKALAAGPDAATTALLAPEAHGGTWYPESFLAPIARNEPRLSSALRRLERVFDAIHAAGLATSSVILAGFSQGACLAAEFVARHPARYRGLLAFTGGLIGPPLMDLPHAGELAATPIYLSAGDSDPHVPWRRMEATREVLERMGGRVTLRRWPGRPHTLLREEIEEARRLLSRPPPAGT
jgi:predicted esterase